MPRKAKSRETHLPQLDGSRAGEAGSRVGRVGVVAVAREGRGRDEGLPVARAGRVQDEAAVGVGQIGQGGANHLLGQAIGLLGMAEDGRGAGITVVALKRTLCILHQVLMDIDQEEDFVVQGWAKEWVLGCVN